MSLAFSLLLLVAPAVALATENSPGTDVAFCADLPLSDLAVDQPTSVIALDIDGDGDVDVASASPDDHTVAWFENLSGDGGAWTRHTVSSTSSGAYSVSGGDLDGDGDEDLIAAAFEDEEFSWFENVVGDGSQWIAHTLLSGVAGASDVHAADLDGDGDLDVLGSATLDAAIGWLENVNGDGSGWVPHSVADYIEGAHGVHAADIDQDGDIDALSAAAVDDEIAWYENTVGDGTSWTHHTIVTGADGARDVYAVDVDGDGDLDALSALYGSDLIGWHENVAGDGSVWSSHVVNTAMHGANSVIGADLDGDGDTDALSASVVGNGIAWHENVAGDGSSWTLRIISAVEYGASSATAGDLDGDGDLDAVCAASEVDWITWFEADLGGADPWTKHLLSSDLVSASSVAAGDLDGDGDLDALSTCYGTDRVAWHENVLGDGSAWITRTIALAADGAQDVVAADVDGDGDLDAVSASLFDSKIAWYENELGDASSWIPHVIYTDTKRAVAVVAADVDGDGDIDVLSGGAAALMVVAYHENVYGDGSVWNTMIVSDDSYWAYGLSAGDVDGDGDLDAFTASYFDDKIAWHENSAGDGSAWIGHVVEQSFNSGPGSVSTFDVDGDGDLDAVAALSDDQEIVWYENEAGDGSSWVSHVIIADLLGAGEVIGADMDGDGDPDVVAVNGISGEAEGDLLWLENSAGDGSAWTRRDIPSLVAGASGGAVADVDGDGDPDLLTSADDYETDVSEVRWHEHVPGEPWQDLGGGSVGSAGVPVLASDCLICASGSLQLGLTNAPANEPALLFIGFAALQAPLPGGGVLVPSPDVVLWWPQPTSESGALDATFPLPAALPQGINLYFQWLITDASAPAWAPFQMSNGLLGTTP